MSSNPLILASGSTSRLAVLEKAGLNVEAIKPNIDEAAAKASFRAQGLAIPDQAMALAELKAVKVSRQMPGLVLGGDQMLNLEGAAFDKPKDLVEAKTHLMDLSGKAHRLETAIVIAENGTPVWRYLARPNLTIRALSEDFIDSYIEVCGDTLLSTVGAYRLEEHGAQLFQAIDGDYFSILGLPLLPLLDYLRTRGVLVA